MISLTGWMVVLTETTNHENLGDLDISNILHAIQAGGLPVLPALPAYVHRRRAIEGAGRRGREGLPLPMRA